MNREEKNLATFAELIRRGLAVEKDETTPANEKQRLLRQIVGLAQHARDGVVPREDWENHELDWIAYVARLRRNLVRGLA